MKAPALTTTVLILVLTVSAFAAEHWPAWRGDIAGSGIVSGDAELPTEWSRDSNVAWRVELLDKGNSTPVIWGDKVFLTQARTEDHWRGLMCFDRGSGRLLWKKGLTYEKPERTHRSNHFCSASAATDGEVVVASYGSAGVVCYDLDGKQLWQRDFGAIDHVWGNSTSPVIHGDLVIHYHGPAKNAVLYALDKNSGKTVWEHQEPKWKPGERTDGFQGRSSEGVIGSFSTPIIYSTGQRDELVMSFPMEIRSFDPATGKILWTCAGLNPLIYTSPLHHDGVVIAMGGYHGNSIGVRGGGSGDVTESHRMWQEVRHKGGIGTGVSKDGKLYFHDSGGVVYCLDIKTGATDWKERLPGAGKSWGSFLLAGDTIYSLSQAGDCAVFKANPGGFVEVAVNELGEETNSSIAAAGNQLFIRTHEALWCIGKK